MIQTATWDMNVLAYSSVLSGFVSPPWVPDLQTSHLVPPHHPASNSFVLVEQDPTILWFISSCYIQTCSEPLLISCCPPLLLFRIFMQQWLYITIALPCKKLLDWAKWKYKYSLQNQFCWRHHSHTASPKLWYSKHSKNLAACLSPKMSFMCLFFYI